MAVSAKAIHIFGRGNLEFDLYTPSLALLNLLVNHRSGSSSEELNKYTDRTDCSTCNSKTVVK